MHKESNPGYPVVSSINCHTANISKYIDYHLQPIVKEISSYVKDTNFINKINTGRSVPQSNSGYEVFYRTPPNDCFCCNSHEDLQLY